MIEIKNLTKRYGNTKAVDDISFTVEKGEILGFLGPNGAGKSTTMNIITGYISASEGSVLVDGHDILEEPLEVKKRIGYLPETPPLYMDMTVDEYLNFVCEIKKVKYNKKYHIEEIKATVGIDKMGGRRIKNLSKGYKQRVGLAQALIGKPDVLILDEPTVGLDPKQIIEIRNVIKELGREHTIILSSHILPEISAVCERVIIIDKGKIAAIDTPENLSKKLSGDNSITAVIEGNSDEVLAVLKNVEGVIDANVTAIKEDGSNQYNVECDKDIRRDISIAVATAGFVLIALKSNEMSLEDIFMAVTGIETEENLEIENTQEESEEVNESDI